MTFGALMFYVFAFVAVASAVMVISARNPVYSVMFLISTFIATSGLFILMGAEYLAMVLVVVYVGAVAVLFLFVVMMLDVDFVELKQGFWQFAPIGGVVATIIVVELILVVAAWAFPDDASIARAHPIPTAAQTGANPDAPNNIEALGLVLYTDYVHYFQIAGLILLIAMIGAIVLTFRTREGVRRQDPASQVARRQIDSIELKQVKSGQGI
ncbi:MAG: NADH-quinone oxidoreductase subunit J [Alphaproteobacteria bacterium]|nr:NADH-quinone oxidoreductase subunit J [Alphaproteobacteria bacterium]